MENLTNFNHSAKLFVFQSDVWLLDVVINGILVVVSLYLLLALTFHQLKIAPPRKDRFLRLSTENRYKVMSKYTCIVIAVASLFRHCIAFGSSWVVRYLAKNNLTFSQEQSIEMICKPIEPLINFFLTIGIALVYQFLWFRQRIFFVHPSLKMFSHSYIRYFSFGVIIAWFLCYITLSFAYFVLVRYRYEANAGCLVEGSSTIPYSKIIITWGAMSIMVQLALLFLFIYPIAKQAKCQGQSKNKHNSGLMRRVKKATILTSICLVTDILSVFTSELLSNENASDPTFDFGVNLVINHLVTIACFDHWKQLLWPWNLKVKPPSQNINKDASTNFTEVKKYNADSA